MRLKLAFLIFFTALVTLVNCVIFTPFKLSAKENLEPYTGNIVHIFTHCLIAYPEVAFALDNFMQKDYDRDCITSKEFRDILQSLYERDYILIKMSDTYQIKNGRAIKKPLMLPKGKKPLVMSFDDVNYDTKKMNLGMVDKIVTDPWGNLASYTARPYDREYISYNKEFISILSNFLKKHPDFSHNGARGLICLTGYDGILGYRTYATSKDKEQEIKKVARVIGALKKEGWEFASHSYGHYHMKKISDKTFAKEIERWKTEVEPLVGQTNIYVYPYGEYKISDGKGGKINKHLMLEEAGFKVFLGVGVKDFFGYAPFDIPTQDRVLFMDRKPIDGNNLRKNHSEYSKLFDSKKVYDHEARRVPYSKF